MLKIEGMIGVYRILFLPGLLVGLPWYAWRMWRRGGYREGFENRFGLMRNVPPKQNHVKRIWIQAVSVGELMAIEPLLGKLAENPAVEVVLTTTTSTGLRVLRERLAPLTAWNGIFPLDFWPFSRRAWNRLQPDLAVLMEGELWPEHMHQGRRRGVPVLLVNARLSDRSYRRHVAVKGLVRGGFSTLDSILAGSESDAKRFRDLGWIDTAKIIHTGNLKLDVASEEAVSADERREMHREFGFEGEDILLLLGSSTWPGEEAVLIEAWRDLRGDFPGLRLVLVPRHAERRKELESLVQSYALRAHFRSTGRLAPPGTEVYIADTTGELRMLTRFADLVYIGKSLPPNSGGQTPVEAAALGKPMIFGPDMSNFRDIARRLVREQAALRIQSAGSLAPTLRRFLENEAFRRETGQRAEAFIRANQGATERTLSEILKRL